MSSIRQAIKEIKEQSSPQAIEFENFVAEFIKMYSDLLRVTDDKIQFNIFVYSEGKRSFRVRLAPKHQLNYYDRFWRITKTKLDTIIVDVLKNAGGIVKNMDDCFWEATFFLDEEEKKNV